MFHAFFKTTVRGFWRLSFEVLKSLQNENSQLFDRVLTKIFEVTYMTFEKKGNFNFQNCLMYMPLFRFVSITFEQKAP